MSLNFCKVVSFILDAQKEGLEKSAEKFGLSLSEARELWRWYETEGTRAVVLYQRGESWKGINGEEGEAEDVESLGLFVELEEVEFRGRVYRLREDGLYRFVLIPWRIRNVVRLRSKDSLMVVLRALSQLQIHGNRFNGMSIEELRAKLETELWLSVSCGTISRVAGRVLEELGYRTRLVCTLTSDEWNTYDNGHSLLEVFYPVENQWILADVDMGLMFLEGGRFLSAYEFWKKVREGKRPEFLVLSRKEVDPFFLSPSGFNHAIWMRARMGTLEGKWRWYQRIFQNVALRHGEKMVYLGDEQRVREYLGEGADVRGEREWVGLFYGEMPDG